MDQATIRALSEDACNIVTLIDRRILAGALAAEANAQAIELAQRIADTAAGPGLTDVHDEATRIHDLLAGNRLNLVGNREAAIRNFRLFTGPTEVAKLRAARLAFTWTLALLKTSLEPQEEAKTYKRLLELPESSSARVQVATGKSREELNAILARVLPPPPERRPPVMRGGYLGEFDQTLPR